MVHAIRSPTEVHQAVIDRRTFVAAAALIGGGRLVAVSHAQPAKPARIGFLGNGSATTSAPQVDALRRGLRDLGWIEGKTITIEFRWADGRTDRLQELAADLVRAKVDVILVSGTPAIMAAQAAPPHDPDRLRGSRRPGRPGIRAQPRTSRRQRDRIGLAIRGARHQAAAAADRSGAQCLSRVAFLRHTSSATSILTSAQVGRANPRARRAHARGDAEPGFDGAFKIGEERRRRRDAGAAVTVPGRPAQASDRARGAVPPAGVLRVAPLRGRRRPHVLWSEFGGPVWTLGELRRSHPERREPGRRSPSSGLRDSSW